MSNVLHDTSAIKLHQTLFMIYPFFYISMPKTIIIIIIQGLGASGEDISGVVVPSIPQNGEQNLQVKFKIKRQNP